ncbi:MAG: deoxyribonuclease IV [Halobacteria archaeon]
MLLGAHVSISGSIDLSVDRALQLSCTTFQIFTRNPRGWKAAKLKKEEIEKFKDKRRKASFDVVVAHMPYLPNIASPNKSSWQLSLRSLIEELKRCDQLEIDYLVSHIGSHLGKGIDVGIMQVARAVDTSIEKANPRCMLLLENMAGQKNSVGSRFEDIRRILDKISHIDRVGICLDTCHLFAAGYDVKTEEGISNTLNDFDSIIGLKMLKVVHLNDSAGGLGSHLDRHEHIGMGHIGEKGFKNIINQKFIKNLPMIIETPEDERGDYSRDLSVLRSLYNPDK